MNKYNSNSTLDFDPKLLTTLLWIVSILSSAGISVSQGLTTLVVIVATFLLLIYEKKNAYIRNHASQCLSLSLVAVLVSILLNSIFSVLVALVYWIPIFNIVTSSLFRLVLAVVSLFFILMSVLGLLKALKEEQIKLPGIYKIGEMIEQAIGQ